MKTLYVEAIGLAAPGLVNWSEAASVLRGEQAYVAAPMAPYAPQLLPPNERRRATAAVRLAFRAAEDAMARSAFTPAALAAVFASSDADTEVMHRICSALASPQRGVSPTDFHNSVHNAAAGYWSIAAACSEPSVSISDWDSSFGAGLCEALCLAHGDDLPVLLAAYDIVAPPPMERARGIAAPFGVALVLTARREARSSACLELELNADAAESVMTDAALETLRLGNPAARALPLLALLAAGTPGSAVLPGPGGAPLRIAMSPA